jgi:hypothetical protein
MRFATLSDIPRIVELAREEHSDSPWAGGMEFDSRVVAETAESFIVHIGKTLMVTGGGYLAGYMQPLGFSRRTVAVEFAWYAKDGSGMKLLSFFEDWARKMGAVGVVVSEQLEARLAPRRARHEGPRMLGDLLCARRAYTPMSRAHIKRLQ